MSNSFGRILTFIEPDDFMSLRMAFQSSSKVVDIGLSQLGKPPVKNCLDEPNAMDTSLIKPENKRLELEKTKCTLVDRLHKAQCQLQYIEDGKKEVSPEDYSNLVTDIVPDGPLGLLVSRVAEIKADYDTQLALSPYIDLLVEHYTLNNLSFRYEHHKEFTKRNMSTELGIAAYAFLFDILASPGQEKISNSYMALVSEIRDLHGDFDNSHDEIRFCLQIIKQTGISMELFGQEIFPVTDFSSPLWETYSRNDTKIQKILLEMGVNPDTPQVDRFLSLLDAYAQREDRPEALEDLILKFGADVRVGNVVNSPLMNAIEQGNFRNAICLLHYGANFQLSAVIELIGQNPDIAGHIGFGDFIDAMILVNECNSE